MKDEKIKIVWEMETGDPDDFFTLLMLLEHPKVDLQAVLVTPGAPDQIGLARWAVSQFDKNIPIGSYKPGHPKQCVSPWHYKAFGNISPSESTLFGSDILNNIVGDDVTVLTGSAPKNLGETMKKMGSNFRLGRWVAQGGFAGEGVVPINLQLPKFVGKVTCPTFNLNGAPKEVLALLQSENIGSRLFVSKNVCHGVIYDKTMHEKMARYKNKKLSLNLMWHGMEVYLRDHCNGKAFHDPLAACCAIDEDIGIWREVEIYKERGEWGSRLKDKTRTKIIIDYDKEKFFNTLIGE